MKIGTLKMGSNVALLLALSVVYPVVASAQEEVPESTQPQTCSNPNANREVVLQTLVCYTPSPPSPPRAMSVFEIGALQKAQAEQDDRRKDLLAISSIYGEAINAVVTKVNVAKTTADIKMQFKGICKRNNCKYKPRETHPVTTKRIRHSFMPVALAARKFLDAVNQIYHINQISGPSFIIAVNDIDGELSVVCGGDYCDSK